MAAEHSRPLLPSEPQIPPTVPDLAEYSRLAATTYEEFSDYSSPCNLLASLKYFYHHSFVHVTALQNWLMFTYTAQP